MKAAATKAAPAKSKTADRLRLAAAAALFSTGGAAFKASALTGWQLVSLRSGIAALAVLLLVPGSRRGWNRRVAAVSIVYASTMILFVIANKSTTAANAIFLQAAAPLYVMVLAPWLLKERVTRADLAAIALIIAGLALVLSGTQAPSATAPDPALGNILAALCGVSWAITVIGMRWLASGESDGTLPTVACGNLVAALACLPLAIPMALTARDVAIVGYLGVIQIGLAYVFLARGIRGVSALEASMLMLVEPALNPLWAWLVHGEEPGVLPVLGGMVIVGATIMRAKVTKSDKE